MLAQDRKTPHPGKRSRRAPIEAAETLDSLGALESLETLEEAPPTAVVDAASNSSISRKPRSAAESRRSKVTARPISRRDSQLVEQATWMMDAMSALDEPPMAPMVIEQPELPAPLEDADLATDVTIVEGDATSSMVAMRIAAPPRKKRHWASGLVILTLIAAVTLTAIATVTPLASGKSEGVAVNADGPLGLPVALDAVNQPPSGHWVALVGVQPNQDVGGGAGPGVKAPGSAGLPLASVKSVVNTGAPSTLQAGAVSPPPLSPWPPTWAYAAVPGYSSFGMSDVGGYYNWAFGQCTWWAQYERRDENLMHMGNAQYWASGARSRGYSVGYTPRVGATVVFQPGVQGAGGAGHVAHVVKVYPDNWFLVSEMNFYWNGGGWGRVDYRFAHAGSGVQFIY